MVMSLFSTVLTTIVGILVAAIWRQLTKYVEAQHKVNEANQVANRAVQKMQLYALYEKVIERGEPLSPEEYAAGNDCIRAYEANGGNGSGHKMWRDIEEKAVIVTGGHGE